MPKASQRVGGSSLQSAAHACVCRGGRDALSRRVEEEEEEEEQGWGWGGESGRGVEGEEEEEGC
eukprot:2477581-Rhodomonas_salina.1